MRGHGETTTRKGDKRVTRCAPRAEASEEPTPAHTFVFDSWPPGRCEKLSVSEPHCQLPGEKTGSAPAQLAWALTVAHPCERQAASQQAGSGMPSGTPAAGAFIPRSVAPTPTPAGMLAQNHGDCFGLFAATSTASSTVPGRRRALRGPLLQGRTELHSADKP